MIPNDPILLVWLVVPALFIVFAAFRSAGYLGRIVNLLDMIYRRLSTLEAAVRDRRQA